MFKKIALGVLLAGFAAVLVWGAMIRTNATTGSAGEAGRRGRATEQFTTTANALSYGDHSGAATQGAGRGGRQGQGQGQGQAAGAELAQPGAGRLAGAPLAGVQPAEWRQIQGTVVSAADDLVEIQTDAGEVIPFEGRPLSYAQEQGFNLKVGDSVALGGFDEDGEFKLGQVTSLDDGVSITLRDASGRPGWAGRGRQG